MLEEEQPLFCCGKSWGDFWEDLEKLEHSLAYKDRVLMHKQVEVQGGFKNLKPPKKKGSETKESGRGGAAGGGGIKLKTTHEFVESQAAKAVVGQTIY